MIVGVAVGVGVGHEKQLPQDSSGLPQPRPAQGNLDAVPYGTPSQSRHEVASLHPHTCGFEHGIISSGLPGRSCAWAKRHHDQIRRHTSSFVLTYHIDLQGRPL